MKSSCTHLAPLMSGIKSSAFDLFSLSLSETFNLSPPGRDWYIKVQILLGLSCPRPPDLEGAPTSTFSSSSTLSNTNFFASSPPPSPTPLPPPLPLSATLPAYAPLQSLHLQPAPAADQITSPPFEHNILLLLISSLSSISCSSEKNNRGKAILGIEFVRGSNSNFCFIFKTKHNFANDKHW